jgi:hypothetical protein
MIARLGAGNPDTAGAAFPPAPRTAAIDDESVRTDAPLVIAAPRGTVGAPIDPTSRRAIAEPVGAGPPRC